MSTPATAAPIAADLFEAELFKLESLIRPLAKAFDMFETEEFDMGVIDQTCVDIARVLNPDHEWTEEELASKCLLHLGAIEASNIAHNLLVNWKLQRQGMKPHPAADLLIQMSRRMGRIGPGPESANLMIDLPWILKSVLGFVLQDGIYEDDPTGGPAIGARILAATVDGLGKVEGLNQEMPGEEAAH